MNTINLTSALRQAAALSALAAHLTAHPHLNTVWVTPEGTLQLRDYDAVEAGTYDPATALLAWAASLTNPTATVNVLDGEPFVEVTGTTNISHLVVWDVVPNLTAHLPTDLRPGRQPLDLDLLCAAIGSPTTTRQPTLSTEHDQATTGPDSPMHDDERVEDPTDVLAAVRAVFPPELADATEDSEAFGALIYQVRQRAAATGRTPVQVLRELNPDDLAFAAYANEIAAFLAAKIRDLG